MSALIISEYSYLICQNSKLCCIISVCISVCVWLATSLPLCLTVSDTARASQASAPRINTTTRSCQTGSSETRQQWLRQSFQCCAKYSCDILERLWQRNDKKTNCSDQVPNNFMMFFHRLQNSAEASSRLRSDPSRTAEAKTIRDAAAQAPAALVGAATPVPKNKGDEQVLAGATSQRDRNKISQLSWFADPLRPTNQPANQPISPQTSTAGPLCNIPQKCLKKP